MPTIKLEKPLVISAGKPIPELLIESGAIKLPFEATGMKTSKNQDTIDNLGFGKGAKKTPTITVKADVDEKKTVIRKRKTKNKVE